MKPVICLGCTFWDTIFRVPAIPREGKVLPDRMVQAASGMATAAAFAVVRLGGEARLWSRIGDDPTADLVLADLRRSGIATGSVRRIAGGRTWLSTILVDPRGERLIVPYPDPSLEPDPSWLPLDDVAGASAVLVDPRWPEGAATLLARAHREGVPSILDADTASPTVLRPLVGLADHVLFSQPGLAALAPGDPGPALLEVAAGCGATVCGVTLGPAGALLRLRDDPPGELRAVPGFPVAAVDTLNAGDVWHGAYAVALSEGGTPVEAARFGNAAAALKCERFGGRIGAPTRDEVEDFLGHPTL